MRRAFGAGQGGEVSVASPGEVLFEITTRGNAARCAAIDASTGVEVVVIGPAGADSTYLKSVALRKLRMRIARQPGA